MNRHARFALALLVLFGLGGCSALDRLRNIGEAPDLSPIENPVREASYRPVSLPMPIEPPEAYPANSLWRRGARSFFKDLRARNVGDVLTVEVTIADEATLENETSRERANADDFSASAFFGYETKLDKIFPNAVDPDNLLELESDMRNRGRGNTTRNEEINLKVAAVVIQVLPNGNLVIQGRQEVRVNFEVRELYVAGVVRPEDIRSDNKIDYAQIAELRVAYGGRGQLTDVQQPRYGAQVLDVILPY